MPITEEYGQWREDAGALRCNGCEYKVEDMCTKLNQKYWQIPSNSCTIATRKSSALIIFEGNCPSKKNHRQIFSRDSHRQGQVAGDVHAVPGLDDHRFHGSKFKFFQVGGALEKDTCFFRYAVVGVIDACILFGRNFYDPCFIG